MRLYFLFASLLLSSSSQAQLKRYSFTAAKMGSPFTIIMYSEDSVKATNLANQCFKLTDSLVSIFSDYIENSELNKLCANAGTNTEFQCSPALFDILMQSKTAYEESMHTFDITLGPLTRLWRTARKEKIFPEQIIVSEKLRVTGFNKIQLDSIKHTATLSQKGMQLDLGGIAQGYIAQKVSDYLKKHGITNALVNVSGDIVCIGSPPGAKGWAVAINVPESESKILPHHLIVSNQAVTTSGDVYQFIEHSGKRYSHIVDPSTGYGIISQRNVTVIATDGTTADWLTKACSILSISKAKKLAQRMGAAVLIAEMKKEKLVFHSSRNFEQFWKITTHN